MWNQKKWNNVMSSNEANKDLAELCGAHAMMCHMYQRFSDNCLESPKSLGKSTWFEGNIVLPEW